MKKSFEIEKISNQVAQILSGLRHLLPEKNSRDELSTFRDQLDFLIKKFEMAQRILEDEELHQTREELDRLLNPERIASLPQEHLAKIRDQIKEFEDGK